MKKLGIFLLLTGCTLGPDYAPHDVCMPANYEQAPLQREEIDLATWWTQFDDPLLNYYVEEALSCNYDLRIALKKIEEVRGLYRIDLSKLYPQIQGNMVAVRARRSENLGSDVIEAAGTPVDILPTDFSGPLIQNFFQIGFDATWELDLFGKNRRSKEAAYRDLEATQEEAIDIQITLISDVARSYIDVRNFQNRIKLRGEQVERQKELLELAENRYRAGLTSFFDVTLAKAELERRMANLSLLKEELQVTIHGLAILLGKNPEGFTVETGEIPKAVGKIPPDLPSKLLCRRPDIRKADRQLAAATARIGVARADFFPNFSLTGNFGTQSNLVDKIFVWPSRFWTIGPTMIWNLFTGGRLIAQVKVANERQEQAILSYERSIINALKEVEDRLVGYFQEELRLEALEERLATNSVKRDLSLSQYDAGLISFDDVLSAEQDLFFSQEEMIESQATLMIQLAALYKSLGGGWQCFDLP